MRTIIAGSRTFNDAVLLAKVCDALDPPPTVVLHGLAKGADTLGAFWASHRRIPLEGYPAQWSVYGKRAGRLRNEEMANNAERLVAFWDGASPGTKHMIDTAQRKGLVVEVVHVT
jgi:hypothetical protein